jgi:hypothetical protein
MTVLSRLLLAMVLLLLWAERVKLAEFLSPKGRPIPTDSRNTDLRFQHVAIAVRDMDRAYQRLNKHDVGA